MRCTSDDGGGDSTRRRGRIGGASCGNEIRVVLTRTTAVAACYLSLLSPRSEGRRRSGGAIRDEFVRERSWLALISIYRRITPAKTSNLRRELGGYPNSLQ